MQQAIRARFGNHYPIATWTAAVTQDCFFCKKNETCYLAVQFWVQDTFLKKDNAQEYSNVNYSLLSPQGADSTDFDEHLENGKGDVGGIALMPMNAKTTARERSPRTPPSTPPRKGSR